MSAEAHKALAGPLRSAIWSWIDHFPSEFNEAVRSRGKMEGVSGVFDLLYSKSSGSERVLWPCLAILHCINSERVTSDIQSIGTAGGGRGGTRAARFAEEVLRQSNYYTRLGQVSLVCATDLCRAAMNVNAGHDEIPLQMLAFDVAHEIKVWFTHSSPSMFSSTSL